MKLTALEWFEYLPKKQRDLAQAYHLDADAKNPERLMREFDSLSQAIVSSFYWGDTEEGSGYWYEIYDKA